MQPTIKDVARAAGVGVGSVSRYLNGVRVKDSTAQAIQAAIRALDYRPNTIARSLKTNRSGTVGILVNDITELFSVTVSRYMEHIFYEQGLVCIISDTMGNLELERSRVRTLADKMVDGLIVYPCSDEVGHLREAQQRGIPVVLLDSRSQDMACDQVVVDNRGALHAAADYLLELGHRRLGILSGDPGRYSSRQRLQGYLDALRDRGLAPDPSLIRADGYSEEAGRQGVAALLALDAPPTALIACNYYTTLGAVKALGERGVDIPGQISLMGFDNLGLSDLVRPHLSLVAQPMQDMGRLAAQLLLARMRGDEEGFPQVREMPFEMLLRDSTTRVRT